MSNIFLIAGNIVKRAFKNKMELLVLLILPIAAIFVMMTVSSPKKSQNITAGIINLDNGTYGEKAAEFISNYPNIKIIKVKDNNYSSALKSSKINIAVIIPENFTQSIQSGSFTNINFKSSSNSPLYEDIKQEINRYMGILYTSSQLSKEISSENPDSEAAVFSSLISGSQSSSIKLDYKIYNLKDDSNKFQSLLSGIGFSIMFIMVLIFTTIGTIMEDKKKLTLARMFTFKVHEWEIAAGNLLGSLTLGILQLIPVTITIKYIFDIPWNMQLLGIFGVLLCFIIASIGIGIGISGIIKDNFHPSIIIATVIFPTSLIGGCLIPESLLPSFIGKLGYAVPQKWVMKAIYEILTGGSYQTILLYLGIILMFAVALSAFGVKTLKPLDD